MNAGPFALAVLLAASTSMWKPSAGAQREAEPNCGASRRGGGPAAQIEEPPPPPVDAAGGGAGRAAAAAGSLDPAVISAPELGSFTVAAPFSIDAATNVATR